MVLLVGTKIIMNVSVLSYLKGHFFSNATWRRCAIGAIFNCLYNLNEVSTSTKSDRLCSQYMPINKISGNQFQMEERDGVNKLKLSYNAGIDHTCVLAST